MTRKEFDSWFISQHGKRPCGTAIDVLYDLYMAAHLVYKDTARYESNYRSALALWEEFNNV